MSDPERLGRPLCARIDRAAFISNIRRVEALCPQAKVLVVVKANAYGHGLVEMAPLAGDRDLAVATSDEAQALIDGGIHNRIWVLEGPLNLRCLSLSTRHEVVWVIHDTAQLPLLQAYDTLSLNVVIKIDTGMHRLGFLPEQLREVAARCDAMAHVHMVCTMSHFASSDKPDNREVAQQTACFEDALQQSGLDAVPQSLSNSGAVLYYPDAHRDWVRPGIMLYGGMPDAGDDRDAVALRPVMHLESAIIALRHVSAGESVGYSGLWTAPRDAIIATIAGGYADGYPRHAPTGTPVVVNGVRCPLVGRVSMDMLGVDVTDVPGVQVGDGVERWGSRVSVDEVARHAGTIAYDLLTGVSARVPREYR